MSGLRYRGPPWPGNARGATQAGVDQAMESTRSWRLMYGAFAADTRVYLTLAVLLVTTAISALSAQHETATFENSERARWMSRSIAKSITSTSPASAECPPDDSPAHPFGPTLSPADSGKLYSSVLSADGQELYFFKHVGPGPEDFRIYGALRRAGDWDPPAAVDLGGPYSDLYPSLSPDGQRLVFASYRPVPGDTAARRNAHLWMARRSGAGWSQPEFVPASRLGYYLRRQPAAGSGACSRLLASAPWRYRSHLGRRGRP